MGGGLSGLIAANYLASANIQVAVFEKKEYPFHRVCGEYISNEVVPFLKSLDILPVDFKLPNIQKLQLTSVNGRSALLDLDLGGFGISRFTFDHFLYQKAKQRGVQFYLNTEVDSISFSKNRFEIKTREEVFFGDVVIGSFGKRSKLDISLKRSFVKKRSPYVGVKYHIRSKHANDLISLHNFKDGYCGISNVEDGISTLCYLTHRNNLKKFGDLKKMEAAVLCRNPFLKNIFEYSEFLWDKPEVINEISFETKSPVENHILMSGDAAGMITPLCGNGMAMAIHAAKLVSENVMQFCVHEITREELESKYARTWSSHFKKRLWAGRQIQNLFGKEWTSDLAVNLARYSKPVANYLVRKTHGIPF